MLSLRHAESWEEYLEFAAEVDEESLESLQHEKALASLPFPIFRFIKAAKRVVAVNKKLISFERGFISEEGIKDREWYRHLGVAPGKWLGTLDDDLSRKFKVMTSYRLRSHDIPWFDGGNHIWQKCNPHPPWGVTSWNFDHKIGYCNYTLRQGVVGYLFPTWFCRSLEPSCLWLIFIFAAAWWCDESRIVDQTWDCLDAQEFCVESDF